MGDNDQGNEFVKCNNILRVDAIIYVLFVGT